MIKNKIKTKTIKKAAKIAIVSAMAVSLIMQSVAAFALEIVPVDDSLITDKSEWGNLVEYTDIDQNYSDKIYDKLKSANNNPELYLNDLDISGKEKSDLTNDVKEVSEELISKNVEDIDSDYEKEQLIHSLNEASDDTLESLKRAEIIETYIDSETQTEEIIDPNLVRENDVYVPLHTPHDLKIPRKSDDTLSLEFNSIKENEDSIAKEIEYNISFKPVSANESTVSVEKNRAIYSNQWDNVDVVYTSNSDSVKEDIILKNNKLRQINTSTSGYQGDNDWIFYYQLDLTGLTPELTSNNQIEYKDENGAVVAVSTAPFMIDNKGEISKNAYFDLLTEEEFAEGYKINKSKFDLTKKTNQETDLSTVIKPETDITIPALETDLTNSPEVDLSVSAQTQGDSKGFFDFVIDALKYVVNSAFQTIGITEAQEIDDKNTSVVIPDTSFSNEFDQTVSPIEKIGLDDLYPVEEDEPTNIPEYKYLALVVNTINLEYPIDIDPSTYILTRSDVYNTSNGLLLSNEVSDLKVYDTSVEPTSNYSYNKELKTTLATNNTIGELSPSDLVGLWTFDENDLTTTVEDDSTTPAVGTTQNDPSFETGIVNSAIRFNGTDEYVSIADDSDFSFPNQDYSFSVWVNPDDLDDTQPIISKGTASNWEYVLQITTDGAVEFITRQLNGTELYRVTSPAKLIPFGQWSHIALINDEDNEVKIFVNGYEYATTDTSGVSNNMANGTAPLEFGRTADGGAEFFDGLIDEVKIYKTILTQTEIKNLYENAKSKLIAWHTFQNTPFDSSGQNNNGVATGTTANTNGKVASSRVFSGSEDINIGHNYSLSPSNQLSLEAWVKTGDFGEVVSKNNEYKLAICSDGKPLMFIYDQGQWQNTAGTSESCSGSTAPAVNDDSWHHLVGAYDGKHIRIYIDGKQEAYYYFLGEIDRTQNNAVIGQDYIGEIDEVAIYNRVLSEDEAYAHTYEGYDHQVVNVMNIDNSIDFTEYAQLSFDNMIVTVPGIMQVKGIDLDGNSISEKIKFRAGEIVRVLSSNHYRSISEMKTLNIYGQAIGDKLQIASGQVKAFSPYHDANWRYGISKADDLVTGIWHFDEGAGSVAGDASNTNNTGYLAGGQSGSWIYERNINLSSATTVDEYQVKLVLTPSTFDYHSAQDDGGDLRFFDSDNIEQPYWIESWDQTGDSIVWIKIKKSGTSNITMQYGNSSASNGSDGEDTFDWFDGFSGTELDTTKWPTNEFGSMLTVSDGIMKISPTSTAWRSIRNVEPVTPTDQMIVDIKYQIDTTSSYTHLAMQDNPVENRFCIQPHYSSYSGPRVQYVVDNGSYITSSQYATTPLNNWYIHSLERQSSTTWNAVSYDEDYNSLGSYSQTQAGWSDESLSLTIYEYNSGANSYYDWIRYRKYQATEPTLTVGGLVLNSEAYSGQPTWYNTSWGYRTPLYIDNSTNPYDLTDYQVLVNIDTSDLVPSKMLASFNDVRFTEADMTTPVDFYHDSTNSTTNGTNFWVEVPDIPAKSTETIYIYYGNSGASSTSSFDNTFTKTFGEDDLRGLWHFDTGSGTTVTDSSGNSHTGSFSGSPTWQGSDGGFWGRDSAVSFSTGNHLFFNDSPYVSVPHHSDFDFEQNDSFTLSTWIKSNSLASDDILIAKEQNSGSYTGYYLTKSNTTGYINFYLQGTGSYYNAIRTNTGITDSNWHHIVGTYNGNGQSSGMKIYIDGVQQATTSISSNLGGRTIRNTVPLNFGSRDAGGVPLNGYLDEVRIQARELTADEITTEYERRKFTPIVPSVSTASSAPDTNVPAWTDDGKYGSALSFDGSNDYVVIPDEDSLNAKQELTIGAWINPGALDGWLYKTTLDINPPTDQENLELEVTIDSSNFDYSKVRADGADLRFADSNGTQLNYYIETWNPLGESTIWIQVPERGTSLVYMYYGNDTAISNSNPNNVFALYDDFEDGTLDTGKWTTDIQGTGTITESGGYADVYVPNTTNSYTILRSSQTFGEKVIMEARAAVAWGGSNIYGTIGLNSGGSQAYNSTDCIDFQDASSSNTNVYYNFERSNSIRNEGNFLSDAGSFHDYRIEWEGDAISWYYDGSLIETTATSNVGYIPIVELPFTFGGDTHLTSGPSTTENHYLDWVRIRRLTNSSVTVAESSQTTGSPASIYQRTITFSTNTPYTNYIAEVDLTPANFDYSHVRADGGDLRFYDSSGNSLSYYIQEWNTSAGSKIYVNIPSAGTSQISMQYGEADVYSLSDGKNTLTLFDNFNDGQFDSSTWSNVREDASAWNEGADISGWFKLKALSGKGMSGDTATAPMILSHADLSASNYEIYTSLQHDPTATATGTQFGGIAIYQDDDNYILAGLDLGVDKKAQFAVESDNNQTLYEADFTAPAITDLKVVKNDTNYTFYYKDANTADWTQLFNTIDKELTVQNIGFISFADSNDLPIYYDNFQVINRHTSNPSTTIGSEQNWTYKRTISIDPVTRDDSTQIQLQLDNTFPYGNLQSAGEDLRFYDDNFNRLDYWIEYWNDATYGNYSSVWIDIPNSGTDAITMYYGNSSATAASSGENTFAFFEDFTGTTIDTNSWVEHDNGSYLSQNNKLIATGGSNSWTSNGLVGVDEFNRSDSYELRFDYKPTGGSNVMFGWHDSGTGESYTDLIAAYYDTGSTVDVYEDGNNRTPANSGSWTLNTNYKVSIMYKPDSGAYYRKSSDGGVNWENSYDSSYSSESPLKIGIANYNRAFEIDNLFIVKSQDADPVVTLDEEDNWFYKKTINLEKNSSPTTTPTANYQVKLDITSSDIEYDNVNDDGSDLRFFDDDGNSLNYWIERWVKFGTSTVWVNVPTSGTSNFTMFYGNPSATSQSNGPATFDFFDDFEDRSLDTSKWGWTREVTGAWDEGITQEGWLMMEALNGSNMWETDNSAPVLATNTDFASQDYELAVRMQASPTEDYQQGGLIVYEDDSNHVQGNRGYNSGQKVTFKKEDSATATANDANQSDTDVDLRLRKVDNTFRFFYKKHSAATWTEFDSGSELDLTMANQYLGLTAYSDSGSDINTYYDDFRINKIDEIDPSNDITASFASEQAKEADLDETQNIFDKGSAYSIGATDRDIYATLGSQSINAPLDDGWNHVVQVFDGQDQKLFVNGDLKVSESYSGPISSNSDNILLGNKFYGFVDDVVISKKAMSDSQVSNWYSNDQAYQKSQPVEEQSSINNDDILTSNLVGHWKLDEGLGTATIDSSVSGNNGTLTNGATWTTGKDGYGISFDGTDDYINTSDASELSFEYDDSFSTSAWFKTDATSGLILAKDQNGGNYRGYYMFIDGAHEGKLGLRIRSTGTYEIYATSVSLVNDNNWHHAVMTYDGSGVGSGLKLYLDGEPETIVINTNNLASNTILDDAPFTIGSRESGAASFDGQIDEVRVYSDTLTESEASALANEFSYRFNTTENISQSSTIDISGNQNNPPDQLAIKINSTGPTGVASYSTSIDNGLSWSSASYVSSIEKSNLLYEGTDTGVDIQFETSGTFSKGDIFKIASWYTEARSSSRGIRRSFPEVANIIATDNGDNDSAKSIEIIDASDNSLWMRFTNSVSDSLLYGPNIDINGIDMAYGNLYASSADWRTDSIGVLKVDFAQDSSRYFRDATNPEIVVDNISRRNNTNRVTQDNSMVLNNIDVNDIDVEMLAGRLVAVAGTTGTNGGISIIDEANQSVIYGTSGGDDIDKVNLATNGNLYLSNPDDNNVISVDNILAYEQNFNFNNRNETYANSTTATYQLPGTTTNDIVVSESQSIADEYSSDKIMIGNNEGLGVIDTMSSILADDYIYDNLSGFSKIITNEYITESMNGTSMIKGMWIAGDQTGVATVQDRSLENNDMTVNGFSSGNIDDADQDSGVRGKALVFDGNDHLSLADNTDFDFSDTDNVSFGAWVNPATSQTQTIFTQTNNFGLTTSNNGGQIIYEASINKNSTDYTAMSTEYDLTDAWHYIVGVHDGIHDVLKLYVDGELEADVTTPANYTITNPSTAVTIGANSSGGDQFDGKISGVFVTENILRKGQIEKLYNIGNGAASDNSDDLNQIGGSSANVSSLAINKANNRIYVGTTDGLSEIDLDSDIATNYWDNSTTPALPNNSVTHLDYANNIALVGTNSGVLSIKTDGSYTDSSEVGQMLSGAGNDVYTDGVYNYYANDDGLDVINLVAQSRLGYILRDGGFNSVTSVENTAFMGTDDNGVYSVNVAIMSGETTISNPKYHTGSSIPIRSNVVYDVHARKINGKQYLAIGTDDGLTMIGDVDGSPYYIEIYNNVGDDITSVWINENGDLAYFNATDSTVNIFDNVIEDGLYPFQGGANSYDRQYSVSTTPGYIGSQVNDIVYVANTSTAQSGYNTLYIATNNGASVIQEHSTLSSGTVSHYVAKTLHDENTGLMLPFDDFTPENPNTIEYENTINQYDPLRQKYDYLSDPDLVGFWDFDQNQPSTVVDRSGHGNDGGYGPNVGKMGGKIGQAMYFDGHKSYVVVNDDKSLHPTSAFSWSGWVWKDSALSNDASGEPILASKFDSGNNGEFVLYFNKNNKLQLKVADGSTNATSGESSTVGTESWHHVAVTFDSGVVNFYIDGEFDSSHTVAVTNLDLPPYNNHPGSMSELYLGNDWSVFNNAYGGYLDEVTYYTRAISAEEIQVQYSLPERSNSVMIDNYDSLAYRTSANLTTASDADETLYLNFDETLSGNQGETLNLGIESELQRPNLNLIDYSGNTNNNVVLNTSSSGWDQNHVIQPEIIKEGDTYKMWYTGSDTTSKIGLATSSDGLNWTKDTTNNPVLDVGSGGQFDQSAVAKPAIIKSGNTYHMWYTGDDGTDEEIGYATSTDGANWTRQNSSNAVLTVGSASSWDDANVTNPTVIKDGPLYKMWYNGDDGTNTRIGYATSSDGINWTRYDDTNLADCGFSESNDDGCIIDLGASTKFDDYSIQLGKVIKVNNKYYLIYSGFGDASSGGGRLGIMISNNGIDWNRYNDGNTILDLGTATTWDDYSVEYPTIQLEGNKFEYYYSGSDSTNYQLGLATLDFEAGRYGKSLRVEDNDIYQYDITNDISKSQGTVSLWAKLDDTTNELHEAFNIQSSSTSSQDGLFLSLQSGQVTAGYNGSTAIVSPYEITNDYWHHFAITYKGPSANNENFKLYIDGELQESVAFDSNIQSQYNQLQIGGNKGETRDYLDGNIDEFRIYNQALNSDEITELYKGSIGNSEKINTLSDPAEGTIEFLYTPDWDSSSDNEVRTMFDMLGGDPLRVGEQYKQSKTAYNRFRIWKEEGPTMDDNDRLHFGIYDNDGDLYEVYTNEDIDWSSGTTYKITAQWDLDNNDTAGGGANVIRILVDDTLMAGDNFTTGDTDNKKKNGTDTGIDEEITIDHTAELMWIGSSAPNYMTNIIKNPSLETANGTDPADWSKLGTITYDTAGSNSKYGSDAVSITGPNTINRLRQTVRIIPGTYTLSWWAKGSASDSTQDVDVQISTGSLTGTTGDNTDPGTNYKYYSITFTNDTTGDLDITSSANTGETVFFDALTLVKGQSDENYKTTSSTYEQFQTSNYLLSQEILDAEYLALTYDTDNDNASLAGETNNASSIAVKKISTNSDSSDDIFFVGTKGQTNQGAVTEITFGSPTQRTAEFRQDTTGDSLTSNRINAISYSQIRNNLAIATDDAGVFGYFDDVPAQITLSTPNGGEEWEGGSSHDISWNLDFGECDNIGLYYSTDDGTTYYDIANGLADNGTYTWNPIASLNSNNVIVKTVCQDPFGGELANDVSDTPFVIDSTTPTFTIYNIPNPSGDNIIYVKGAGTDTGGATSIDEVKYKVDDSATWSVANINSGSGTTSVEFDFSTPALSTGAHDIYVTGKDSSLPDGNEGDLSSAATRSFNVDSLSLSFDKTAFDLNLSINGDMYLTDSVGITVTGYGTDYSLAIKANQAPKNRYYPSESIPFYTGNDDWSTNSKGFGWKTSQYNSGNYNDFETSAYEIFKNSFASLVGDNTTVDFKAAIDWTVAAGDYDSTVSIVVIPRY